MTDLLMDLYRQVDALARASANLSNLSAVGPEVDRTGHSMLFTLLPVPLALAALAPFTLRGDRSWWPLAGTGVLAILLAMTF